MAIRKKSKETLEQQKSSFLNFAGTQKKYEPIIAELFLMDDEKIDDINYVKNYLKWKWIDGALVDNFEYDYKKYLKNRYFYWPIDQYPSELQSKIIKNNKILEKLKKEIVEDYKKVNDFDLIVSNKKFEEFIVDEIWYQESFSESKNINDDISNIEKRVKEKNDILESTKQELREKEKEYDESYFISFIKKFKLKKEIDSLKGTVKQLHDELTSLKGKKDELYKVRTLLNWIKSYKQYRIDKKRGFNSYTNCENYRDPLFEFIWLEKWWFTEIFKDSFDFSENGKNNYKAYCKSYFSKFSWKIKLCSYYMKYDDFFEFIILPLSHKRKSQTVYGPVKECKKSLEDKINEYLNYFFFWENKDINCIYGNRKIPTVFSWEKIDEDILNIIKVLKNFETDFNFDGVDERFMDDLFVHKSDFRVLDEILKEWGLISHNEILRRSHNSDIKQSMMSHDAKHKDVYFSRWFNQHWYWLSRRLEDKVFYVNTMNNFAARGYWVPLNLNMQKNWTIEENSYKDDWRGFSIVSNSSLGWNSYGKVDTKDLFIFVSENKKSIIESNPNVYPTDDVHIIYIPKEYYTTPEYTYKIYEFIEQQMEQFKQNKRIVPYKIIWNKEDNIWSGWGDYLRAFCSRIWEDNVKNNIPNLLWNWSIDNILTILKRCSFKENTWFIDKIKQDVKNVDFDNVSLPKYFPMELFKLLYTCLKIEKNHRPNAWSIWNILSKSWYSQLEIAIFIEIARNWEKSSYDFKPFCDDFSLKYDDILEIKRHLGQLL